QAVHPRHVPVEQHQADVGLLGQARQRLLAVARLHALVPQAEQDLLDHAAHDGRVVDDQHLHLLSSPRTSASTRAARPSSATTSSASPASISARGMPKTAQLARSCAIAQPPARRSSRAPRSPSDPMPVSTSPSTAPPPTRAADSKSASTEGASTGGGAARS